MFTYWFYDCINQASQRLKPCLFYLLPGHNSLCFPAPWLSTIIALYMFTQFSSHIETSLLSSLWLDLNGNYICLTHFFFLTGSACVSMHFFLVVVVVWTQYSMKWCWGLECRGIAGDLFLVIHVKEEHGIWRDGLNLYSKVEVDYTGAILGTVTKVVKEYSESAMNCIQTYHPFILFYLGDEGNP